MEKETKKQLSYIKYIEDSTGIVYEGSTKADASKYIAENKDKIPEEYSMSTWSIINGY